MNRISNELRKIVALLKCQLPEGLIGMYINCTVFAEHFAATFISHFVAKE